MKNRDLNEAIAEKLFGWRWIAYQGIPTRSYPGYRERDWNEEQIRVRRFFSPGLLARKDWQAWCERANPQPADGTEPLDYCYGSSMGPEIVPDFTHDWNAVYAMENVLHDNGLFYDYIDGLSKRLGASDIDSKREFAFTLMLSATRRMRCEVALEVVEARGGLVFKEGEQA